MLYFGFPWFPRVNTLQLFDLAMGSSQVAILQRPWQSSWFTGLTNLMYHPVIIIQHERSKKQMIDKNDDRMIYLYMFGRFCVRIRKLDISLKNLGDSRRQTLFIDGEDWWRCGCYSWDSTGNQQKHWVPKNNRNQGPYVGALKLKG